MGFDVISYALSKKKITSVATGISEFEIDGTTLKATTNDGQEFEVDFPVPKDGVSVINVRVDERNHIVTTLSDSTEIDSGLVNTVKGDTGDDGFSPSITVEKDTEDEYILSIQTKDGVIVTPDLKQECECSETVEEIDNEEIKNLF